MIEDVKEFILKRCKSDASPILYFHTSAPSRSSGQVLSLIRNKGFNWQDVSKGIPSPANQHYISASEYSARVMFYMWVHIYFL